MGLFGNRFKKIKRNDVVNAIVDLQTRQREMSAELDNRKSEIAELYKKGKKESDRNMKVFYAQRINSLQQENALTAKSMQFLNSNITALIKLKGYIDQKEFMSVNAKIPLNKLLQRPADLNRFVAEILEEKMKQETNLEKTFDVFEDAEEGYVESDRIYGVDEGTNNILAMFETEQQLDDEATADGITKEEEEEVKVETRTAIKVEEEDSPTVEKDDEKKGE